MSLRTIFSGATAMVQASMLQFITDMLRVSGVLDTSGTMLQVTAGSGLSVNIAVGRAYLLAPSGGDGYPVINDATVSNLAVTANASGNPRITSTVLYINLGASANAAATNVATIINVDGTPGASPSAPSGATIQAAVGSGNPYTILANVLVNSGASVPTSITDKRTQASFRFAGMDIASKAKMYLTTAQTGVVPNTYTKVLLDTVAFDPGSNCDVATNHRFTAPYAGYYHVIGSLIYDITTTQAGKRFKAAVAVNGSIVLEGDAASAVNDYICANCSDVIYLNAGDYVELNAFHTNGVNQTITGSGSAFSFLTVAPI